MIMMRYLSDNHNFLVFTISFVLFQCPITALLIYLFISSDFLWLKMINFTALNSGLNPGQFIVPEDD